MSVLDEVWLLVVQEISAVVALGWEIVSKDDCCHGKVREPDLTDDLCYDLVDVVLVHQRMK